MCEGSFSPEMEAELRKSLAEQPGEIAQAEAASVAFEQPGNVVLQIRAAHGLAIRRELVNHRGQQCGQPARRLGRRHAKLAGNLLDGVVPENLLDMVAGNGGIRAGADPLLRLRAHAMSREFLHHALNAAVLRNQAGDKLEQLVLSLATASE